jgi:hypothetical protein
MAKERADQLADDQRHGIRHITISDLELDRRTIPANSTLLVQGWYYLVGRQEWLGAIPNNASAPRIGLITDDAPREARALLQRCRIAGFCGIDAIGHLGKCAETFAGSTYAVDRCLYVSGVRWQ